MGRKSAIVDRRQDRHPGSCRSPERASPSGILRLGWLVALLVLSWGSSSKAQTATTEAENPATSNPSLQQDNHRFSLVLLDQDSNNLKDDIRVDIVLLYNDTIHAVTQRGFLSLDLEGKAKPKDVLLVMIPYQTTRGNSPLDRRTYYRHAFLSILSESQNLVETVVFHDPMRYVVCRYPERPIEAALDVTKPQIEPGEMEPLFSTKSPAERQAAKAARATRRNPEPSTN